MEQDSTNDDRCSAPSAEMPNLEETSFPTAPYLFSVCRVCVTRTPPNHSRPWVKERSLHVAGSGFVIDGRLILTNAHCISYATVVKVQRHLSDQKFLARVVRVCYDCDVAVLGVDSDDFWLIPDPSCPAQKQNLLPLQFGELPNLQDTVRVIGYPLFGTEICITQGVVSRIQLQTYFFSNCELLSVQTDGSVNPGSSGGPVLNTDNLVVGIAFQSSSWENADRVGQFIPYLVFQRVVNDHNAINGDIIHFAGPAFWWQDLESPSMRRFLGFDNLEEPNTSGVYVTEVQQYGSITSALIPGDAVVAVEDLNGEMISLDNEGTIPFRSFRIGFPHLFTSRVVGEVIRVGIVREGKRIDVEWHVDPAGSEDLVPKHDKMKSLGCDDPEYTVIGGLVFVGLNSYSFDSEWDDNCPSSSVTLMKYYTTYGIKQNRNHEVIILSQVLDAEVNTGFDGIRTAVLESFNGILVNSLAHLQELWAEASSEFVQFGLNGTSIVLDRQEAIDAEEHILATHNIPAASRIAKYVVQDDETSSASCADADETTDMNEQLAECCIAETEGAENLQVPVDTM